MYPFHSILETYEQTLRTCFPILGVLFCLMYVYAAIGLYFFGRRTPDQLRDTVDPEAPFISDDYVDYLNFTDAVDAMITLFHLVTMSGWWVTASGYAAATSAWAYAYFLSFWVGAVLIMYNVVVAFVIDTFMVSGTRTSAFDFAAAHTGWFACRCTRTSSRKSRRRKSRKSVLPTPF
jgi:hypothetical protein